MIPYRLIHVVLAVCLGLISLVVLSAAAAEDPDSQRIAQLITQLSSDTFREREEATRALEAIGTPALEALRKAAQSPDPEVRHRAEQLVRKITEPMESAKLLAPLRIQLKYQDTPVEQAVKDLAKQTGYPISLAGSKARLAGRRVTLSTGETTFWQAFDQFCVKAGLVEEDPAAAKKGGLGGMVGGVPPGLPGPGGAPVPGPGQLPPLPGLPPPGAIPPPPGGLPVPYDVSAGKLILVNGKPRPLPTWYAGAVRVRALSGSANGSGDIQVTLELTPEPRMQWRRPGSPQIDQAVDDRDQTLSQTAAPPAAGPGAFGFGRRPDSRQVSVRLSAADKPSKVLKLLKGTVTGEVQTPLGDLVEVKNILKAVGQTIKGKGDTSLEVLQVGRRKDGAIQVQVKLMTPSDIVPAATDRDVVVPPGQRPPGLNRPQPPRGIAFLNPTGFALLDAKDRSLPLAEVTRSQNATGNAVTYTLTFQPQKGQGDPAKLRFTGARVAAISVPFTLRNVPLP
jgi:hypothetical protein